MKQVVVSIGKNGVARVELDGFVGEGCGKVVEDITSALSGVVLDDTKKAEFYTDEQDTVSVGS
jgi:hypothetical protein